MTKSSAVFATRRPPIWLSPQQAAAEYGVSLSTIRRRITEGRLPAYRVGQQLRIKATDLDKLAQRVPVLASR